MDIVEATNEFQEWELLQSSSDFNSAPVSCPDSGESFTEIDSGGLVQVNYFSLDAQNRYGEDLDDDNSSESDNPSWIDPGTEDNPARYLNKEPGEFWSDSSSERSVDRKSNELDGKKEMDLSRNEKNEVRVEGVGEIFEEKAEGLGIFCLESSGIEVSSPKHSDVPEKVNSQVEAEVLCEEKNENRKIDESGSQVVEDTGNEKSGELNKRSVVWWKMPVEFLKYCVFRMSPLWAVSVAAAVMGFAILGRRLYKMKKKTRGLEIKIAVDDKKVSQVMSRAARLNEAFSIVKRVPVIRPWLPAIGSTNTWPVMTLR